MRSLISGRELCLPDEICPEPEKTICITGHREKSITPFRDDPIYAASTVNMVRLTLSRFIDIAVEHGYTNFISGLAMGTDLWAAKHIIEIKKKNSSIKLFGAMPFLRHAEQFPYKYKSMLRETELYADAVTCISQDTDILFSQSGSGRNLYRDRNYFMVDRSSAVIAFLNDKISHSGTAQTVRYAYKTGRKVNLFNLSGIFDIMERMEYSDGYPENDFSFIDDSFRFNF